MTSEGWRKKTTEEQNAHIAKLLGVHRTTWLDGEHYYDGENYVGDLNAMHKAERRLNIEMQHEGHFDGNDCSRENRFAEILGAVVNDIELSSILSQGVYQIAHATAAQRAEAFVLTMDES